MALFSNESKCLTVVQMKIYLAKAFSMLGASTRPSTYVKSGWKTFLMNIILK